ncbi:MAG: DUF1553 domain-containing protein [Planctomycetota bacterium]|nr:DUF1553 domain-containing protein [Planctomycetota bacterium]MDA1213476.1 DUF1553 domain-containing protein [Planctomycetota bacterium]
MNCSRVVTTLILLTAVLLLGEGVRADETPLSVRIDGLISARFGDAQPAASATDAEFLRRIWLDLAGTIPTADETRTFLADTAADKRERMIDRLLAAPTYATRMQELFHVMLMERRGDNEQWDAFLRTSFEQNKHWDQFVREILYPDAQDESRKGAGFFYTKRLEKYGENPVDYPGLTRDVARLLLGLDLQCAQCHNHLFIDDYKQLDFQGLYTVYLNVAIQGGVDFPAVTEKKLEKELEFVSVFDPTQRQTGPRIPFWKEIPIPEQPAEGPPVSVLALLAEEFPKPENSSFSKNIANRLWFIMMGRGLVHPLDLHHSGNPPSHPELLDLLAAEFIAHDYDIKWMLRELALTQTYQRSSRYADDIQELPLPETYLVFNEKRLSAEQLLNATLTATGNRERVTAPVEEGKPNPQFVDLKTKFLTAFANEPREAEDDFNATVKGALFTLNDDIVLKLTTREPGNLIDRLLAVTDGDVLAEELYLSVFSRSPFEDERTELKDFLAAHAERREAALSLWTWSMVTSMEFVVNH